MLEKSRCALRSVRWCAERTSQIAEPMLIATSTRPSAISALPSGMRDSVLLARGTNEFGDRLIVSHAKLQIQEALKGSTEPLTLDYEGGTVDGVTLHVSSLPVLRAGERGVFFVTRGKKGEFKPHLRGQGILKLDPQDRVPNSSLTLSDVRRMAASVVR